MAWQSTVQVRTLEADVDVSMFLTIRLHETTTAHLPPEEQEKRVRLCCFHTLDVRAEFDQFFIKVFVTTIDVIDAAHFGNSVRL